MLSPSQMSAVQGLPSSAQMVPAFLHVSAGHCGPLPSQYSARSHAPAAGRHIVLAGANASAGHSLAIPSQVSATSHGPAAARHTAPVLPAGCWHAALAPSHWSIVQGLPSSVHAVAAGLGAAAGHRGPLPEQVSATSHSPAVARHTVLGEANPSVGQPLVVPSHASATSQAPAAGRQMLPAACLASAGQVALVPVQASATSHTPPAVRQVVPEG